MTKYRLELKWGLIFAGVVVGWILVERLAGLHDRHIDKHPIVTSLFLAPAIALYALALLEVRRARHAGAMTFKQGLASGLLLTGVIAVLSPVTQSLNTFVISPDYFQNAIQYSVDKGMMSLEAARRQFSFASYLMQGFVGALVTGAVMSAFLAGILRRKAPAAA